MKELVMTSFFSRAARFFLPAMLTGLLFSLSSVHAQQTQEHRVKQYGQDVKLSPDEIANILGNGVRAKMRGVRLTGSAQAAANAQDKDSEPTAFALQVPFAFDSASIMPKAQEQLDAVAAGIKQLEGAVVVVIEGHTDAHGRVAYNNSLSQRRAESVKRYLTDKHKLDVELLKTEGKGAADPINKQNPFAGENRRVQFRAG
jgi:outer membrane protein OmpA-like peptidoglycan-associated protein